MTLYMIERESERGILETLYIFKDRDEAVKKYNEYAHRLFIVLVKITTTGGKVTTREYYNIYADGFRDGKPDNKNADYAKLQMQEIRKGLEAGVDVSVYADARYNHLQMGVIRDGLEAGIDVAVYADPKFDFGQMVQIYLGLKAGVDVSVYADPKNGQYQMGKIRERLEANAKRNSGKND